MNEPHIFSKFIADQRALRQLSCLHFQQKLEQVAQESFPLSLTYQIEKGTKKLKNIPDSFLSALSEFTGVSLEKIKDMSKSAEEQFARPRRLPAKGFTTPKLIPNEFTESVKAKRLETGLNQEDFQNELEKISGVSFGAKYVSLVETGARRNVPREFLVAFSELAQININEIITLYETSRNFSSQVSQVKSEDRLVLLAGNTLAETLEAILTKKYEPAFRRIMREKAAQVAEHIEKNSGIAEALTDIETWQGRLVKSPGQALRVSQS